MGQIVPVVVKLDIPPLDSPQTPKTPLSPTDITLVTKSAYQTPKNSGGRWINYQHSSEPLYLPPSIKVAKKFLRSVCGSNRQLPPRPARNSSNTPVSSNSSVSDPSMICHGCHGMMGAGMHSGSATGKNNCKFKHSLSCPGNIAEDDTWKACPPGHKPGFMSSDTGFEQTLEPGDFVPPTGLQSSTPSLVPRQLQSVENVEIHQPQTSVADILRFQRQANGEGVRPRVIQETERFPGMVPFGDSQPSQALPQGLEQEVAALRALNQQAERIQQSLQQHSPLTIGAIRRTPGLRDEVDNHVDNFRAEAPVFSSAPSAPAPGLSTPPFMSQPPPHQSLSGSGYQFNAGQLHQINDGIRVTSNQVPPSDQTPTQFYQYSGGQPGQASNDGIRVTATPASPQDCEPLAQELADVRAQFASLVQQQQQAARQLDIQKQQQEHQRQAQLAQEKAVADLQYYKQQMAVVAAQLKVTQEALGQGHSQQHLQRV